MPAIIRPLLVYVQRNQPVSSVSSVGFPSTFLLLKETQTGGVSGFSLTQNLLSLKKYQTTFNFPAKRTSQRTKEWTERPANKPLICIVHLQLLRVWFTEIWTLHRCRPSVQDCLFKARVHSKIKDVILTVVTVVTVYTSLLSTRFPPIERQLIKLKSWH